MWSGVQYVRCSGCDGVEIVEIDVMIRNAVIEVMCNCMV